MRSKRTTVRLSEEDWQVIEDAARLMHCTIGDVISQIVQKRIRDTRKNAHRTETRHV